MSRHLGRTVTDERMMRITEQEAWALHHARLAVKGPVLDIVEKWFTRNGWFFRKMEAAPPKDSLVCYLDGNALCVVGPGFVDLQESEVVFLELTAEQLANIERLKDR